MTVVQSGVYAFPKEADGPRGSELQLSTNENLIQKPKRLQVFNLKEDNFFPILFSS